VHARFGKGPLEKGRIPDTTCKGSPSQASQNTKRYLAGGLLHFCELERAIFHCARFLLVTQWLNF
jgi:hypothetical protein